MLTIIIVSFLVCLFITLVASYKEGSSRQWNIGCVISCITFLMCLSGQVVVERCNLNSYVSTIRMEERLQHCTNHQLGGLGANPSDAVPSMDEVYSGLSRLSR